MNRRLTGWWRRRTLHGRLALLVGSAVAVAVLSVAVLAWAAVGEVMKDQIRSQLETDAQVIAAQPELWRTADPSPPSRGHDHREIGPRWQILDKTGAVVSESADPLPVSSGARAVALGHSRRVQEQITDGPNTYIALAVPATGGGAVQVAVDRDPGDTTMTTFGLVLAIGSLIGVALAALLGRIVARAGLVPIQRLTAAVETVAETQDLTRPVPVTGDDEIGRLAGSVNSLLAAIDSSRRAQRALVEDAGHELRTPLTSIRGNIELLLRVEREPELAHRLPPAERARLVSDLDVQVRELATLATELVELSREETTRETVEEVSVSEVVQAAIARARVRAPGLTFTTDLEPVTVAGRPAELERMVLNVLDNAAKWSPPGATVHTELTVEGDRCRLWVTDAGPGIAAEDLPHVFDRFYRAPTARAMPGSGLGLAIVEQAAATHGGSVTIESEPPHGTVVIIDLPRLLTPLLATTDAGS